MRLRVLGPVEVDETDVGLRPRETTLLCALVLASPDAVADHHLLDALWGDDLPASATHTMRAYISRIRQLVGADAIETHPGGYRLTIPGDQIDAVRFEHLVATAPTDDPAVAAERLAQALGLWRGEPLVELHHTSAAAAALARLLEMRRTSEERWAEAVLALGEHERFVGELERLAQADPLRERRWELLMTGLVRSDRRADALRAFDRASQTLHRELAVEPGPALRALAETIRSASAEPAVTPLGSPAATAAPQVPAWLVDTDPVPFVGREGERQCLRSVWKEATDAPQLVMVVGEAGIGKTRLVAEVTTELAATGARVLAGRCDRDLPVGYQPFADALAEFAGRAGRPDPHEVGPITGDLLRLVPTLERSARPVAADDDPNPYRLFEAVGSWLTSLADEHPVVLVLDDLQWATTPTLLLLRHLVRTRDQPGLLIVATVRPLELGAEPVAAGLVHELSLEPNAHRLEVGPVDPTEVSDLISGLAGQPLDAAGRAFAFTLHDRCEGNPLLVRELLRHLVERGAIAPDQGRWCTAADIQDAGVPLGINELVHARVARLSDAAQATLQAVAIGAPTVELAVVAAMLDGDPGAVTALDECVDAGLLTATDSHPVSYGFTHELLRASVYDGLGPARRARLHLAAAEAIARVHPATLDDWAPELALHHGAAVPLGSPDLAVRYATRAGQLALARLAHADAAEWYERALELLDRSEQADGRRRCDLLIALGDAQRRAGDPTHRRTLLDAGALALELGDAGRTARAALAGFRGFATRVTAVDHDKVELLRSALAAVGDEPSSQRADLLTALSIELSPGPGTAVVVQELVDEAVRTARLSGEPETVLNALSAEQLTYPRAGEPDRREAITAEMIELADVVDDWRLRWIAHAARSTASWQRGDLVEHQARIDACAHLAVASRAPTLRWNTMVLEAVRPYLTGDLDLAINQVGAARSFGTAIDEPDAEIWYHAQRWIGRAEHDQFEVIRDAALVAVQIADDPAGFHGLLAWARLELGEPADASLVDLVADLRAAPVIAQQWSPVFVEAAVLAGDWGACEHLYDLLGPWDGRILGNLIAPWGPTSRYLGMLATALGRIDRAEGHLDDDRGLCERIGARCYLAHNQVETARLLLARDRPGDRARADELLRRATDVAEVEGYQLVARRAEELLAAR